MRPSLVLLLVVLFLSLSIAGNAATCPSGGAAIVEVTTKIDPLTEQIDTNLTELDAIGGPERRGPKLGLYTGFLVTDVQFEDGAEPRANGALCVRAMVVRVKLRLADRIVHLPAAVIADTCIADLATAHLKRHAVADESTVRRFAPRLRVRLQKRLAAGLIAPSVEAGRRLLLARLTQTIDHWQNGLDAARTRIDRQLDSAREGARAAKACAGLSVPGRRI